MEYIQFFQETLVQYGWLGLFMGSFFFGETVIVSSALVVFTQGLSVPIAVLLAFLGTVLSDTTWFLLSDRIVRRRLEQNGTWAKHHAFIERINTLFGRYPFLVLLVVKFLYGTRILTIVYLSIRRLPLWQFLLFNAIGTLLWLGVLFGLSYSAVQTATSISTQLNTIQLVVGGAVIVLLAIKLLNVWITKRLGSK